MASTIRSAKTARADVLLLLTAAIWGFAFVAQRAGMEHIGPFTFNGIRFALGASVLIPLIGKAALPSSRSDWLSSLLLGSLLFLGASLQQIGLIWTTAGNAGFITGLYVLFVPLIAFCLGRSASVFVWISALLAASGLYLLSVREGFRLSPGDTWVLLGSFAWAAHVLCIEHFAKRRTPLPLAFQQFIVCSLLSLLVALFFEEFDSSSIRAAMLPILYAGFVSVGIAYTLQVVAQRDAPATHASVLLSLESVFAALGGWMLLQEQFGARQLLGCTLMLLGMLLSQFKNSPKSRRE